MSIIRTLFYVSCFLVISGCLSKVNSIRVDNIRTLDDDSGYLFMSIDSDIKYSNIRLAGTKYYDLLKPLYFEGKSYYLIEVPAGSYHIEHFGEPWGRRYNFDKSGDEELWGFTIHPGVISYVGELKVRKVSKYYSRFDLVNNSSLALEFLAEKYPNILSNRALEYHGPGKDFFYQLVLSQKPTINSNKKGLVQ